MLFLNGIVDPIATPCFQGFGYCLILRIALHYIGYTIICPPRWPTLDKNLEANLTQDTLASLRNRRVAHPSLQVHTDSTKLRDALKGFNQWFTQQRADRGILMRNSSILETQESVSSLFGVGLYEMRYFCSIPNSVSSWFCDIDWAHVAICPETNNLFFVHAGLNLGVNCSIPAFALKFNITCAGLLRSMSDYHFLDLRSSNADTSQKRRNENETIGVQISKAVARTLPIRVVEDKGTLICLLDGRKAINAPQATS